jgi:peptidyl-prolyl cis-trans isomerase B (cyclophilin B)
MLQYKWIIITVILCLGLSACKSEGEGGGKEGDKNMPKTFSEPKSSDLEEGVNYQAIISTAKGDIKVDLFEKEAPLSVTNFKQLAEGGFYNDLTFHRVEPGFVIQGGDPEGTGRGGPGYTIPAEIKGNPHKHVKGALAWARLPDTVNPQQRSSGSQFYVTLAPTPFLDGGYTVFGVTLEGIDVVGKIAVGDKIKSIKIVKNK